MRQARERRASPPSGRSASSSRPSRRRRSTTTPQHLVGHRPQLGQRLVAVAAHVQVHLDHALGAAEQLVGVQQHRGLDRVPGGERKPLEELAPRRHLARERLSEARQLGIEGGQERPRHQLRDPAAVGGQLLARRRCERPPERRPSRSARPGSRSSGPSIPSRSGPRSGACPSPGRRSARRGPPRAPATWRRPCRAAVRARASARPPGAPRRRGARPARRCRPRRPRRPRAPGPRAPGSASRLSTIGPIVSATSRVGSTTVTGSRLRSSSSSRGNSEWW